MFTEKKKAHSKINTSFAIHSESKSNETIYISLFKITPISTFYFIIVHVYVLLFTFELNNRTTSTYIVSKITKESKNPKN